MKIKKGDKVKVILGKDRGREGSVEKILSQKKQALVKGINLAKKHLKPRRSGEKGGIVSVERPILLSKLMLLCPKCNKPIRVAYQVDKNGKKYRICRKCRSLLDSIKK
ncbi:MAG: 50S ribosomal protein L24 [Patescibacteria group bacterium]